MKGDQVARKTKLHLQTTTKFDRKSFAGVGVATANYPFN